MKNITEQTDGIVTRVKTCWWLKINTKPIRLSMFDGAVFPHIIHFAYTVDGLAYQGKRYISYKKKCPQVGEKVTVYYDGDHPRKYSVEI